MIAATERGRLKAALEKSGSDWVFRYWGAEAEKNLDRVSQEIERFLRAYRRRFGEKPDPYALLDSNPPKGAAFFQMDSLLVSVEMKIMIWRILLGCEIARVEFKYRVGQVPSLTVALVPPYGQGEEIYTGQQPSDFRVLRHLGVTGVEGQLFLQGYYAAKGI